MARSLERRRIFQTTEENEAQLVLVGLRPQRDTLSMPVPEPSFSFTATFYHSWQAANPQCGGPLSILTAIEEPAVITKILTHLGLPTHAPPKAPARFDASLQTA